MQVFTHSIIFSPSWVSQNQLFTKLTKEKKIAIIALAIFSCCGIFFAVYRYLSSRKLVPAASPDEKKNDGFINNIIPNQNDTQKCTQDNQEVFDKSSKMFEPTLPSSLYLTPSVLKKIDEQSLRLRKLITPTRTDYIATHLMNDKLLVGERKKDGSFDFFAAKRKGIIAAKNICHALEQLKKNLVDWKMDQECKRCLVELNDRLCPLLDSYQKLAGLIYRRNISKEYTDLMNKGIMLPSVDVIDKQENDDAFYLEKIMSSLRNLNVGEGALMLFGCIGHETELLIERTGDTLFRLTHYNTGYGIDFHNRYQNTHLYQTYDVIEDVPASSVLDEEKWKSHFFAIQGKKEMGTAYEWIRNEIGVGGIRVPPSEHIEDYEDIQFSRTCAIQSKMALLRHQCMQIAQGTPSEKESCYKVIKSCFFLQYLKDHQDEVEDEITKHFPSFREKLEAEQILRHIASDEQQMTKAFLQLKHILTTLEGNEEIVVMPDNSSFLTRYAVLRKLSVSIYKKMIDRSDHHFVKDSQHPALCLVIAKLNHYECMKKNLKAFLEESAKIDQSILIERLHFALSHTAVAMDEAVNILEKEFPQEQPPLKTKELLELFNRSRTLHDPLVNQLSESIRNRGNAELSKWLLDYWEALKDTSVPL